MKKVFCLILCLGFISLVSCSKSSANVVGCWEESGRIMTINSDSSAKYREGTFIQEGKWQLLDDKLILKWNDGDTDTVTIIKQTSSLMIVKWNGFLEYTYVKTECQ